LTQPPGEGQEK